MSLATTAAVPAAAITARRAGTTVRVFVAPGFFNFYTFTPFDLAQGRLLPFIARDTGKEYEKGNRKTGFILPPEAAGNFLYKFYSKDILSLREKRNTIPCPVGAHSRQACLCKSLILKKI
jgi:hypothetical protein